MADNLDTELESWSSLGVAGALAGNYARDVRGFLPLLAAVLTSSMPEETQVERKGGFFQKEKPVRKVIVTLGDQVYTLEDLGHGPLAASRQKSVRGIVLKTDALPLETWLTELSVEIAARAKQSEKAFFALKNLLD